MKIIISDGNICFSVSWTTGWSIRGQKTREVNLLDFFGDVRAEEIIINLCGPETTGFNASVERIAKVNGETCVYCTLVDSDELREAQKFAAAQAAA